MDKLIDQNIISKTDFCKGFSIFHIQWPVPLTDENNPTKYSDYFTTTIHFENKKRSFRWYLYVNRITEKNQIKLGIIIKKPDIDFLPAIFRFALLKKTDDKISKKYCSRADLWLAQSTTTTNALRWNYAADYLDEFGSGANLIMNIWLDIPKIVVEWPIKDKHRPKTFFEPKPATFAKDISDPIISALVSDMANLYSGCLNGTRSKFSDVQLVIDNDKGDMDDEDGEIYFDARTDIDQPDSFFCHRNILASRSSVFRAMFTDNQFKEGQQKSISNILIIKIQDIDFEAMRVLVKFVYTGIVPDLSKMSDQQLFDIIYASDKYDLVVLRDLCASTLICYHGSDKLRIQQLELAARHNLTQLKAVCVQQLSMALQAFGDSDIPNAVIDEASRQNLIRVNITLENRSN